MAPPAAAIILAVTLAGPPRQERLLERLAALPQSARSGVVLLLGSVAPGAPAGAGGWSEIVGEDALRHYVRGLRHLVLTTVEELPDIEAELEPLLYGIDRSPFFVFLVKREVAPLYRAREDGPVASFCCSADLVTRFLSEDGRRGEPLGCFGMARLLLALQDALPRILVRQLPLADPMAAPPPARRSQGPISVAVPHRGPVAYLVTCLRSLLSFPEEDIAVDVVLDEPVGPAHRAILEMFPQVAFHAMEPIGSGPYAARQFLIERGTHDLLAQQDSDDLATADRLGALAAALGAHDAEIVGSQELRVDEVDRRVLAYRYPLDVSAALAQGPYHAQLFGTTMARRRSLLEAGGLSTARRFSADTQFMFRAFLRGRRMINVDAFLYIRRRWGGALTSSPTVGWGTEERRRVEDELRRDFARVSRGQAALEATSLRAEAAAGDLSFTDLRQGRTAKLHPG